MRLHFSSFELGEASFFEERLTFIWAFNDFKWAHLVYMLLHLSSRDTCSTIILTLDLEIWAVIPYVIIHVIEREHKTTF